MSPKEKFGDEDHTSTSQGPRLQVVKQNTYVLQYLHIQMYTQI